MNRLFLQQQPSDNQFLLDRSFKKRLVKVLRMRSGDLLHVWSPGKKWECKIAGILPDGILLQVLRELTSEDAPGLHLVLAQAIPKGERFDWLIQKATELGISEIVPLITERTIVHPGNIETKLQRWNTIATEAAGQSENPHPTSVHPPLSLSEFLKQPRSGMQLFLRERGASSPLKMLLQSCDSNHITFVVGPEGGWSEEESLMLQNAGFLPVSLGTRILRSETAGIALAAILQYELG